MSRKPFKPWTLVAALAVLAAGLATLSPLSSAQAGADKSKKSAGRMLEPPRDWTWADKDEAAWNKLRQQLGKPAPKLTVKEWMNGEVTEADTRGKVVVYDFWATWCRPCIASIPHTNELAEKFGPQGVKVVGICASKGGEKMADTVKQHGMQYPTAVDVGNATTNAWSTQWFPYFVVVDRNGIIRAAGLRPDRVDDVLEALLKEQPPEESAPASNG